MERISPLPPNEETRLRVLRRSTLLDSQPERMFDAITARASEICQTPIALISLVDKDRQWFKSRVGLDTAETHRNVAFCSHAILQNELMVVPDALNDHRFAENPLVRQAPSIRFYAGMPLIMSDGSALGTLCVIDQKPRELTKVQTDQLKVLAESARILLEVRTADGCESDLRFIFANDALYRITGYSEEDQSALQTMAESIQLRQTSVTETLNYTKAGTPFWTRFNAYSDSERRVPKMVFVVGLQSDITAAREMEAARQKLVGMTNRLSKINALTSFRSKMAARGLAILDTE